VREETGSAEDFPLILRNQPQRAHPMEKLFSQFEIIDIGRGGAVHFFINVARRRAASELHRQRRRSCLR
jgi:hypothetical protein